ncbi:hypothetical protein SDRG_09989 [Saprolegnia diclina VS20]|uniref:FAD/NAD(P)-binding domain-containing protein n=1 Tax=Saprolegnia diclina (strain VS20) TaxID=1156394 RepID=T0Q313_SAPDV|nr:hypothetical protein SDRG_09989 [Saprolegnia diclina VS20]EQC32239.1 hypothetical protein SDRG_09989 [Saprolegnia diclina VS20]|eukprot:XP_008614180.1 hypothetical protein SDRG_09989 [Saprolegnia diclina VS20]
MADAASPVYKLAILGGGPAGIGIFVRAARLGYLDKLLSLGVVLVHGGPVASLGRGNLGDYIINSNTFAKSLLGSVLDEKPELDPPESIRGTFLEGLEVHPAAQRLSAIGNASINLVELGKFLEAIGYLARLEMLKYPGQSACLHETTATHVERLASGVCQITISHHGVEETILADHVVLAMGGTQELPPDLDPTHVAKAWTSDAVLREPGRRALANALSTAKDKKVCIIGGSHSAFSVAWVLLNKMQPKPNKQEPSITFGPKDLALLHRGPIRCFYNTKKEAEADGVSVEKADKSGSVNTFTGLREDAKALYVAASSGHEPRLKLYMVKKGTSGAALQKQACDAAAAIVWCCGYTTKMLPVTIDGAPQTFASARGAIKVDLAGRVVQAHKSDGLDWLYGVGVGFALRAAVDEMKTETRADGVTVYHRRGATLVLAGVFGAEIYGKNCATFEEMVDKFEKRRKEERTESKIPVSPSMLLKRAPQAPVADDETSHQNLKLAIVPRKNSRVQAESPVKPRARNQGIEIEAKALRRSSFEAGRLTTAGRPDVQAKSCGKPVLAGAAKHAINGIRTRVL